MYVRSRPKHISSSNKLQRKQRSADFGVKLLLQAWLNGRLDVITRESWKPISLNNKYGLILNPDRQRHPLTYTYSHSTCMSIIDLSNLPCITLTVGNFSLGKFFGVLSVGFEHRLNSVDFSKTCQSNRPMSKLSTDCLFSKVKIFLVLSVQTYRL